MEHLPRRMLLHIVRENIFDIKSILSLNTDKKIHLVRNMVDLKTNAYCIEHLFVIQHINRRFPTG